MSKDHLVSHRLVVFVLCDTFYPVDTTIEHQYSISSWNLRATSVFPGSIQKCVIALVTGTPVFNKAYINK